MASSTQTPSKLYTKIAFTPSTKKQTCIVCGKKEVNDQYRLKLFKGDTKTSACILIEKNLGIEISHIQNVDSVCKNCFRSLSNIQSRLHNFKESYEKTIEKLKVSHGRVSKKRLPFSDCAADSTCKKIQVAETHVPSETEGSSNLEQSLEENVDSITNLIQNELKTLCGRETQGLLGEKEESSLTSFSWENIANQFKEVTPVFWKLLEKCVQNPRQKDKNVKKTTDSYLPGIASAACKLVSLYNSHMNALQKVNSLILLKSGAKQTAFRRFHSTSDCLTYPATLTLADTLGKSWEDDLKIWVESVENDAKIERQLEEEIDKLETETIFLDTTLEQTACVLQKAQIESQLEKHRSVMHPGFYFVGDNVDMRTKVRHMTLLNQNKDEHMFQICAYQHRVPGNHLSNNKPRGNIETVEFKSFVPDVNDTLTLSKEFTFFVAQVWSEIIPHFHPYKAVLPSYLEHPYMEQTSRKTDRVNLGVLKKNEQYNEDMADICTFINQYVPGGHEDGTQDKPEKTLSGGDYLTFERHKQAQAAKRNGRTPYKRMEGLVPKMEEFHNQAEFLQVIWKVLYTTASSKDTGTLFAARNSINSKNVTKDPASNYYASSDLIVKFTKAYIVSMALVHFNMETVESAPRQNSYDGEIGDEGEMKEYLLKQATDVVNRFTYLDFPSIPETGYQSNSIICRQCGKKYVQAVSLQKHEMEVHGITLVEIPTNKSSSKTEDFVLNYTKVSLTLGLLKMNHDNALEMGDGERIIRLDKVFYMYYKAFGCTKYAYGMLETLLQVKVLLSERLAHRLTWNRTVNNRGKVDSNLPNDLDIEHCNKVFKDEAHSYRGVFTEKVISRVSRCALKSDKVLKNFDKVSKSTRPSGKHTPADVTCDILALVDQFKDQNLFETVPGRKHSAFGEFKVNQIQLNMNSFRDWLSKSMKKIANKHFYRY